MRKVHLTILALLMLVPTLAFAQKPKWVNNTPRELNSTYRFVEVVSTGSSIESARMSRLHQLALNEKVASAAKVAISSGTLTTIEDVYTEQGVTGKQTDKSFINVKVDDEEYTLQARLVDEYLSGMEHGMVQLHSLYMVAVCDNPIFDHAGLSTSYGVTPLLMSIVPGAGQWYKGSKAKGAMFLGGTAALAGSMVYCQSRITNSRNLAAQTYNPEHLRIYSRRISNFSTARNVCIGAAAALYVWNLVDAVVAPGARRIVVRPAMNFGGYSLENSNSSADAVGLSAALTF